MKRMSFLLLVGIVIFAFSAAFGGYKFWKKSALEDQVIQVESALKAKQSEVLQYQNQNIMEAISAKEVLDDIQDSGVKWSKVIKTIRNTLPENESGPITQVLSYSASANKSVSLNMKTLPGSETPYFDVAKLIKSFDESDYFTENFVPSISGGADDEGSEVLSFVLSTKYVDSGLENPSEKDLQDAVSGVLKDSLTEDSEPEASKPPEPVAR